MTRNILRLLGAAVLVVGVSGVAFAQDRIVPPIDLPKIDLPPATPEIDLASAASALTLLSGGVLVIRGRRKSKQ